jgi:hypothetical protein
MDCDPHWTTYLSALLVPTVAVLGSVIAYRQWRTAQNKLKLDLFEMRFSIYEASRDLLASILTSGQAKDEELFKYLAATREAKWLLNAEVAQFLDKVLYHKVIDLQTLRAELEGMPVGEERSKNVRKQAEIKKWLIGQYEVLDEKLSPFLKLRH